MKLIYIIAKQTFDIENIDQLFCLFCEVIYYYKKKKKRLIRMDDETITIASTFLILKEEVADKNAKKRIKQGNIGF